MRTEELGWCLKTDQSTNQPYLEWFEPSHYVLRERLKNAFKRSDLDAFLRERNWSVVRCRCILEEVIPATVTFPERSQSGGSR